MVRTQGLPIIPNVIGIAFIKWAGAFYSAKQVIGVVLVKGHIRLRAGLFRNIAIPIIIIGEGMKLRMVRFFMDQRVAAVEVPSFIVKRRPAKSYVYSIRFTWRHFACQEVPRIIGISEALSLTVDMGGKVAP